MTDAALPTSLPTRRPTPLWHGEGAPAALAAPVRKYLRTFQKLIKARPTDWHRRLMTLAAVSAARLDQAMLDPGVSGTTLAHYERVQRKTYAAMLSSFPKRRSQPPKPLLADLLVGRREAVR